MYTSDRRQAGIAVLDTDIFEIQKLVTARGLPSSLTADVLDGAGTVLASSRPAALMRPMKQNAPSDLARALETVLTKRKGELLYTDGVHARYEYAGRPDRHGLRRSAGPASR